MTRSSSAQPDAGTALITGGGAGIGRSAAVGLASEGYEAAVASRTAATVQETVKLVTETGGMARYVIADVHDEDAVRHAVEVAAGEPAQLDVAVNSAGVDGGNDSHPFVGYPVQTLDLMRATNARGMFFSMKHELEIMANQGFGSIVNISLDAGLTGAPGRAGHVASNHAEIGLTKSARSTTPTAVSASTPSAPALSTPRSSPT
jgi:NAD(P)-dependent dehydrogenase (short-subunit alcohol dehydrogenase family)